MGMSTKGISADISAVIAAESKASADKAAADQVAANAALRAAAVEDMEAARAVRAIDAAIRAAARPVTVSATARKWGARITEDHDARAIARELGVSLAEVQADIETEAAAARDYKAQRAAIRADKAARVTANRSALASTETAALREVGRAVLDSAWLSTDEGQRIRSVLTVIRAGVDHVTVMRPASKSAWDKAAAVATAHDVEVFRIDVLPKFERNVTADHAVATLRMRHGQRNKSSVIERKLMRGLVDTEQLSELGISQAQMIAGAKKLAELQAAYDALKVGRGQQGDKETARQSLLTDTERKERARLKKAAQRARKRLDMGKIARGYNKGGLGR